MEQADAVIAGFEADEFGGKQAVELQYPLWRTSFYPILVLMEAWSRSTGMPTVFYYDAFCALLMGLLHKEICVDVAGYPCRSRYWGIGTARPGSGKSPAVDCSAVQEPGKVDVCGLIPSAILRIGWAEQRAAFTSYERGVAICHL